MFKKIREFYHKWDILFIKCYMCEQFKTVEEYPKDKTKKFWIGSRCIECDHKHRTDWRETHKEEEKMRKKEYRKLHPEVIKKRRNKMKNAYWINVKSFHNKTEEYIQKNNLRPELCSICNRKENIEFHHISYDNKDERKKWIFVCKKCHKSIHNWKLDCPPPIDLTSLPKHKDAQVRLYT